MVNKFKGNFGSERESENVNQELSGYGYAGEVERMRFRNPKDPKINDWVNHTIETVKKETPDPKKAKIIACVPVENIKEWDLNNDIGQAIKDKLIEKGMESKNISIIVEPMTFWMLSTFINEGNWKDMQKRLDYATDEDGAKLGAPASKRIDNDELTAARNAPDFESFRHAIADIGNAPIFFPGKGDDKTITWLYDEMRRATIRKEKLRLEALDNTPKIERPPQSPPPKFPPLTFEFADNPIELPPVSKLPELSDLPIPPDITFDVGIDLRTGTKISTYPPSSIFSPPISLGGRTNPWNTINTALNLNHLLGISVPLENINQPKKTLENIKTGRLGALFGEVYFDNLRALPASYSSRLMQDFIDMGSQIKIGKLQGETKYYFFSSIPVLPIRGNLPLMDGVGYSFYNCTMLGAAYISEWMHKNWGKNELVGIIDLRGGVVLSNRSIFGGSSMSDGDWQYSATQKPAAFGLKLVDKYMQTTDTLPDLFPVGVLDARIIFTREMTDKVSIRGTLTLSGVGSIVSAGMPSVRLELQSQLKDIVNTSFMAMNAGANVGLNVPAQRFEEFSAHIVLRPKDNRLPVLSFGASETYPLKGNMTNIWGKLEESINSQFKVYAKGGASLYPNESYGGGKATNFDKATNFEAGISWQFKANISHQPEE